MHQITTLICFSSHPAVVSAPIDWNQGLNREWRCSWSSADRRCSNYIWVINDYIPYKGAFHIRGLTPVCMIHILSSSTRKDFNDLHYYNVEKLYKYKYILIFTTKNLSCKGLTCSDLQDRLALVRSLQTGRLLARTQLSVWSEWNMI